MLSRTHRLSLKIFRKLTEDQGSSLSTPLYNLKVHTHDASPSRFAFLVSKKVSPKATDRNLIKRHLSSAIHSLLPQTTPGHDVIFYAKRLLLSTPYDQLVASIKNSFLEAKIITS